MKLFYFRLRFAALAIAFSCALSAWAQTPDNPSQREGEPPAGSEFPPPADGPDFEGPPPFGPGGFGPGGPGPGGLGGMMQPETKLVKQFDKDGDGRLNQDERKAARASIAQQRGNRGTGGRRGGFGAPGENQTPPQPGPKLSPSEVKSFPDAPIYDIQTLRTFFLEFENADWEKELAAVQ